MKKFSNLFNHIYCDCTISFATILCDAVFDAYEQGRTDAYITINNNIQILCNYQTYGILGKIVNYLGEVLHLMKKLSLSLVISILCFCIILLLTKQVFALNTYGVGTTYYVSTTGNDLNTGTKLYPWKTIKRAAASVKPGDTVYIRGGIYKERVSLKKSGSPDKYITFSSYPKESVTIDGASIDWGYSWDSLFNLNGQSYIKIKGLKIINSSWFGIGSTPEDSGSQYVIIENCITFNTKASGIAFYNGSNITIKGNSVERACNGKSNTQECISLENIDTFAIIDNHVFNCTNKIPGAGGEGINVKNGCANGTVCNNIVNGLRKVAIYIDAYSKHQYNISVCNNKIYDSPVGIAVATENSGHLENISISYNQIYNCVNWGFVIGGWGDGKSHAINHISYTNNTTYNVGDGGIYICNSEAKDVIIANNIFGRGTYSSSIPVNLLYANHDEITFENNLFD